MMPSLTPLVGLGASGHAKVIIDILRLAGGYEFVGLLTPERDLWGTRLLGVPVIGDDDRLPELIEEGISHGFVGVGMVGNASLRIHLYLKLREFGFQIVPAIHPSSIISDSANIGRAPMIGPGAIVNAAARVGDNVLINSGAIVEHDCEVGDHVHIASGAQLAGAVWVGDECMIGMGACIRERVSIGRKSIVGAGAVVVKDVPDGVVVAGVPARITRSLDGT